jgi:hypothetical protein
VVYPYREALYVTPLTTIVEGPENGSTYVHEPQEPEVVSGHPPVPGVVVMLPHPSQELEIYGVPVQPVQLGSDTVTTRTSSGHPVFVRVVVSTRLRVLHEPVYVVTVEGEDQSRPPASYLRQSVHTRCQPLAFLTNASLPYCQPDEFLP